MPSTGTTDGLTVTYESCAADTAGIWTTQTGIFPENQVSLALHRKAGFTTIGTRHHIDYHRTLAQQRWRDVTLIERRIEITPPTLVPK